MASYSPMSLLWPKLEDLLSLCGQSSPYYFPDVFPFSVQQACEKIGEGMSSDVYHAMVEEDSRIFKVMPIDGSEWGTEDIKRSITEVSIPKELAKLSDGLENRCSSFCTLRRAHVVKGLYPMTLQKRWDAYKNSTKSRRRRPGLYPEDQLYVCLEFDYAGSPVTIHPWTDVAEAISVLKQTACALAVAEQTLSFEHGDLHSSNVLVQPTSQATVTFVLNSIPVSVETHGVKVSIIDFSRSTISDKGASTGYQDVLQFDVVLGDWPVCAKDQWDGYFSCTNMLWLRRLCKDLMRVVPATAPERSDTAYQQALQELIRIDEALVNYDSTSDFVKHDCSFGSAVEMRL